MKIWFQFRFLAVLINIWTDKKFLIRPIIVNILEQMNGIVQTENQATSFQGLGREYVLGGVEISCNSFSLKSFIFAE